MTITVEAIIEELKRVQLPDGSNIVDSDMVRAVTIDDSKVNFVLEVPGELGERMEPVRSGAEALILRMDGVNQCNVMMTAHSASKQPPSLKIGGHAKPQDDKQPIDGVKSIIAIGSGKGGVGKSTVSSNLAVALSKLGLKVGLLDADIHGPSQPRMMGVSKRPASPDGKTIIPLKAHGVTMMSLGLMLKEDEAVIWRGPMLMGALQQMLNQVEWGQLDVLLIDLPPGTGDVQLTLSQKTEVSGAIIVSTPQDVALLDARKAINMFERMEVPIIGMIENMSSYHCPNCGHEAHIFGHGGAQ
ncbi:Mrp/NBP35 family ATP-binding protein, partial [Amylibacter sp.]|nr:Mrp/NBP35 family ATP-binding protein [Amylibacter sp.]